MTKIVPDLETAYLQYRHFLFRALACLARQGFVVPPEEGLDFIQEFFAHAWHKLCAQYNPEKGEFESYLYVAFVHFVRPRIVRLHRWQSTLIDSGELDQIRKKPSQEDEPHEAWHDVRAVTQALSQLPTIEQQVLRSYLIADIQSERKLAEEFSVSRYRIRETLIDALGHVTVLLGEQGQMSTADWQVALAIWKEIRTVREAAAYLGQSVQQVREARFRIAKLLATGLKAYEPKTRSQLRRPSMDSSMKHLIKEALASPWDSSRLAGVRLYAKDILDCLEQTEGTHEASEAQEWETWILESDPHWVAKIYETIAGEDELSPEDQLTIEELVRFQLENEVDIGHAFTQVLMADLPKRLQNFEIWLEALPKVPEEIREELANEPVSRVSQPYSKELNLYGITPLTIFYAIDAISGLLKRLMHHEVIAPKCPVMISPKTTSFEGFSLFMIVQEMMNMADCSEAVAHALFLWLCEVAPYKPFIFEGFYIESVGKTLSLVPHVKNRTDLKERWGSRSTTASA